MPEIRVVPPPLPQPPPLPPESWEVAESPRPPRRPNWLVQGGMVLVWLLIGSAQKLGWTTSVMIHTFALTLLAMILVPLERKEPPRILTASEAVGEAVEIGEDVADFTSLAPPDASVADPLNPAVTIGGSHGNVQPDLALLSGPQASGLGQGMGAGRGDAAGREADARIAQAGGRGGVVQIAILWDDRNDLDLHVLTPRGTRICYLSPKSPDGGELDVDMNVRGESLKPVENIRWLTRAPQDGLYRVQVHYFERHDRAQAQSPFRVVLRIGEEERVLQGVARQVRQFTEVATFEIKEGRGAGIKPQLTDFEETEVPEIAQDPRRLAQREQFAREALQDALAATSDKLRAGKLRRVVERFPGTESAEEARRRLQQMSD